MKTGGNELIIFIMSAAVVDPLLHTILLTTEQNTVKTLTIQGRLLSSIDILLKALRAIE